MYRDKKWSIPVKKFEPKPKALNDVELPIDHGMLPSKRLLSKEKTSSWGSWLKKSFGRLPFKLLSLNMIALKEVMLLSNGILPARV